MKIKVKIKEFFLFIIFSLFLVRNDIFATSICSLKPRGDANCDAVINLKDFEIWRREYLGSTVIIEGKKGPHSDFNQDKKVDLRDFEIWRKNIGAKNIDITTPSVSSVPVSNSDSLCTWCGRECISVKEAEGKKCLMVAPPSGQECVYVKGKGCSIREF